jgi:hypothetical protein
MYLRPSEPLDVEVPRDGAYWIIVPVGLSGVGFLGDLDKFVSDGKNRIARLADDGEVSARVIFADNENRISLHGYSPVRPDARASGAEIQNMSYDPPTLRFKFDLVGRVDGSADVFVRLPSGEDLRRR